MFGCPSFRGKSKGLKLKYFGAVAKPGTPSATGSKAEAIGRRNGGHARREGPVYALRLRRSPSIATRYRILYLHQLPHPLHLGPESYWQSGARLIPQPLPGTGEIRLRAIHVAFLRAGTP